MAGQRRVVRKRGPAVNDAIMRHVRVSHKKIAVPDHGLGAFQSPRIDGHIFADAVAVADLQITFAAVEFFVLCTATDHGPGEDLILGADRGMTFEGDARADLGPVTDFDGPLNERPGADLHPLAEHGVGMNDRRRVDLHLSTTANFTSASHTRVSFT